jgi:hypothetical protein
MTEEGIYLELAAQQNNPPNTNLAEVGHPSWAHQGANNLDLVTAAKVVSTHIFQVSSLFIAKLHG